ncbi:MAG: M48 family metalloprotease, partial [Candidatus Riflebacteria bacterium]|nr:M48 family metalloprotease [Candidatus Riflebacteria bacterium]
TPYAAERLNGLAAALDVPLGGQRVGAPVYVVDGPPGFKGSVEAGPRGAILVARNYLEKLSGVTIDPADPSSVNAAVRSVMNNGRRQQAMASILGHELGHLSQGHGRFVPQTEFRRAAADASNHLVNKLYGTGFTLRLQEQTQKLIRETPAGQSRPEPAKVSSHVHEYLADQHAVTSNFLRTGDLRGSLDFWNKVGGGSTAAPTLLDSHPTGTARILNALSYVEQNPQLFAPGLDQPLHIRVKRDLPAVKLERVGDRIVVTGREALVERLSPPERLVFQKYQSARSSFQRKVDGFVNRRLLPEYAKYRSTEPYLVEGFGGANAGRSPAAPRWAGGGAAGAAASLRNDVAKGGMLTAVGITAVSELARHFGAGRSLGESASLTAGTLGSRELLLGNLVAGTLGAALGSAVPLPGALQAAGLVGQMARTLPVMALASIAASLGTSAVSLQREGKLTWSNLLRSVDWLSTAGQIVGSVVGMNLAAAGVSAGLLPALSLGPVALVPLVGGIVGSILVDRLISYLRSRDGERRQGDQVGEAAAEPAVDAGRTGAAPAAPISGASQLTSAPRPRSPGSAAGDEAGDDPFRELRLASGR